MRAMMAAGHPARVKAGRMMCLTASRKIVQSPCSSEETIRKCALGSAPTAD